jgi:hypothetical protein
MTEIDFGSATNFVWLNARLLDRLRFAYHFLDAGTEPVLKAVVAYQNADGGFGNGLDPTSGLRSASRSQSRLPCGCSTS